MSNEEQPAIQQLQFRYVGEEPAYYHPALGLLTHDTLVQPSSFEVAEQLKTDSNFVQINVLPRRGKK